MSKFKILWIDDSDKKCKKERLLVKAFIESLDLTPDIRFISDISKNSLENKDGALKKALSSRDYDLLVIDYWLSKDVLGSTIIAEVRNKKHIYADIVFYSSSKEDLAKAVQNSYESESAFDYFDGVYVAPMQEEWFLQKIQFVIQKIVNSWFSPNAIRGVILDKTSKIETIVCDLIAKIYKPYLIDIREFIKNKKVSVQKSVEEKWTTLEDSSDPIAEIISNQDKYNWNLKKQLFDILLEKGAVQIDDETSKAIDGLFIRRNMYFAHNKAILKDGVIEVVINGKTKRYDDKKIAQIRHDIYIIEKYFESLGFN